jgi:hypothetical protein
MGIRRNLKMIILSCVCAVAGAHTGLAQGTGNLPDLPPVSSAAASKTVLALTAASSETAPVIEKGLRWRVFSDQADLYGNHALVSESDDGKVFLTLDPGGYIVHVAYGLASATRHIILGNTATAERLTLDAGALQLNGMVGDVEIASNELEFEIRRIVEGGEQLVAEHILPQQIVRINTGAYQITSIYGKANARIVSEITVQPGKLSIATVHHKAGRVQLKLMSNGTALEGASWSILTPGGDAVSEDQSSPEAILTAGEYIAVARLNGKIFQQNFTISSGEEKQALVNAE